MYTFSVKFNITPIRRLVPSISTADAPFNYFAASLSATFLYF